MQNLRGEYIAPTFFFIIFESFYLSFHILNDLVLLQAWSDPTKAKTLLDHMCVKRFAGECSFLVSKFLH